MKFEAKKGIFLEALQLASSAIPNKTTLQILNNFLFNLKGNELEITSTDLDLTINLKINVSGSKNGGIVVNAKKFLEVIRELPDLPVQCSVDNYVMTIQSETGFQCNITGFDASEYPALPEEERKETLKVPIKVFKELYEKTYFAASNDFTSRLALTGVYFESKNGQLIMVGTDGHRLGKAWEETSSSKLSLGIILPPRAINQVIKMAPGEDEEITVEIGAATAKFKSAAVTVYSKLIEGPYPDYQKVIPSDLNKSIVIQKEEFISVLKRVGTMAHAKTRQVKFTFEKDKLFLSAKNLDLGGESEESLPVNYSGKSISVGFNGTYVLEVLRLIHTDEVCIKLNSNLGATIFQPQMKDHKYFFIVMPLRLLEDD